MKRYWKSISLVLFTTVVWAGFFIQSSVAVSQYPDFVLKSEKDQEELGSRLAISGNYYDGMRLSDYLTITEKGSDYLGDKFYLSQIDDPFTSLDVKQLKKDHRNFMRGKMSEPELFYNDKHSLAYVNISSDTRFRGYEALNQSLEIDILTKGTGDRTSFNVKLPAINDLTAHGNILSVHCHENKLKVAASISFFDTDTEVDKEEMHLFTIDIETQELIDDELIVSKEEHISEQHDEWPVLEVISGGIGGEKQTYNIFMKAIQEVIPVPNGEERGNFKDSEFIAYNLESGEQTKLDLPDDIQPSDFSDTFYLEGTFLYFSKVEDKELKVVRYDISKQAIVSEQTYAMPGDETEEGLFVSIENDKMVLANRYKTSQSETSVFIYDLNSAEKIYEGMIDVNDNKLKSNDEELVIIDVNFR